MTKQYTDEFKAQVLKEVQEVRNAALVARCYELSSVFNPSMPSLKMNAIFGTSF